MIDSPHSSYIAIVPGASCGIATRAAIPCGKDRIDAGSVPIINGTLVPAISSSASPGVVDNVGAQA